MTDAIFSGASEDPNAADTTGPLAADLFRRESARLVAWLTGQFGTHHLQLAEDAVQEALVRALQSWPYRGVPENPGGWLSQTARNIALDALRRDQRWTEKESGIAQERSRWMGGSEAVEEASGTFTDDTLRLMFVCLHPQLSQEAQVALALRTLCGLSPAEIAAGFLTTEAAVAKRLVRARQRIRELALPFAVPGPDELPARLEGVLGTLYLLFNEGYKASGGERLVRQELCHEAIRLAGLLLEHPATATPATQALMALMLLTAARLPARTDADGALLRLREQDRSAWDRTLIARGILHLGRSAAGDTVTAYHLEAGIAACHSTAVDDTSTNWTRILNLYDQLVPLTRSPVAAMNRAVAVGRVHGPRAALEALDQIPQRRTVEDLYLYHAIRATFATELGQYAEARGRFQQAAERARLPAEREFIARRLAELERKTR